MSNGFFSTKYEPDDHVDQDEKRQQLVELLNGVWQFDDIVAIQRLESDTHRGWLNVHKS